MFITLFTPEAPERANYDELQNHNYDSDWSPGKFQDRLEICFVS